MGKKGGSSQPQVQRQEVSQSNIPEYARPYFMDLMNRSQGLLTQSYTPYGQERIAGFTPEQQRLQQQILGMQAPGQFGQATGMATRIGQDAINAGKYDPRTFNVQNVTPGQLEAFQMEGPEKFTGEAVKEYMSPYMQNVLEIQKREAMRDAQRQQLAQNLGATREGTYGGSRQLLAAMQRERNLGEQMGDIQAKGQQSAFEAAQNQFNAMQQMRQQAAMQNLASKLGVQQLGAQQGLQAALANQQYGLEAQRLGEQSRQFGSQQGLAGLAQQLQAAQLLGTLGQYQQQGDLARYGMQQQTAAQQQALNQQRLDQQYQDFLRQRDYPLEMLQQYSSLLRGVPVQLSSTSTTYAPQPGIAQQLLGTGLGAASIYKTFAGA